MAQKKLFRFAQIKTFSNVLEYPVGIQGKWEEHFKNDHPVVLELACGRGEYTVELARLHPEKNFIGIDIKGNRMYIGARKALAENLNNAAFLRTQIEKLPDYFNHAEVDEIWITFPDPQLRMSKAKKRLTHPRFLRLYHKILKRNAPINLKTDSPDLFLFTKKVIELFDLNLIEEQENVYGADIISDELRIKTHYESMDIAQSNRIHYLRFSLPDLIPDLDEQLKESLVKNEG
jgi:tRNA (guanine-N7-)-methyltransferase